MRGSVNHTDSLGRCDACGLFDILTLHATLSKNYTINLVSASKCRLLDCRSIDRSSRNSPFHRRDL